MLAQPHGQGPGHTHVADSKVVGMGATCGSFSHPQAVCGWRPLPHPALARGCCMQHRFWNRGCMQCSSAREAAVYCTHCSLHPIQDPRCTRHPLQPNCATCCSCSSCSGICATQCSLQSIQDPCYTWHPQNHIWCRSWSRWNLSGMQWIHHAGGQEEEGGGKGFVG